MSADAPTLFGVTDASIRTMVRDVRAVVRNALMKRDDCEGAVLFALHQAARLNPEVRNLPGWLRVVACNHLRTRIKRRRVVERTMERFADHVERTTDHPGLARLMREDARAALHEALGQLPPRWRTVIVLHHLDGLPFPVIAQQLHMTEGAAKQLAYNARHKLRRILTADPRVQ